MNRVNNWPKKTAIGHKMTSFHQLIEVAELKAVNKADACRVIDCRFDLLQPYTGRSEYLDGHIPGAVYADLNRDLAAPVTDSCGRHPLPEASVFQATLANWGIGSGSQVVVYDHASGGLAARLWWMLRWLGHQRVAVLNGGLTAWCAAGEALEQSVPNYPVTIFSGSPDPGRVVTTDEVCVALHDGRPMHLVDARDRPRFDGHTEPIDSVAGHVPGALNFPFSENLHLDGTWKSPDELRRAWAEVLGTGATAPITVMCGSGVTACHLVLSAGIAGLDEPRVYIGSWSEWLRDASRPVAVVA